MSAVTRAVAIGVCIIIAALSIAAWLWLRPADQITTADRLGQGAPDKRVLESGDLETVAALEANPTEKEALGRRDLYLAGRVIDKVTREPVKTFHVRAHFRSDAGQDATGKWTRVANETVHDEDGVFCYRLAGDCICRLVVSSSRYPRKTLENIAIALAKDAAEIVIELDPGSSLAGRVVDDATGSPVEGAFVAAAEHWSGLVIARPEEFCEQCMHSQSDEDGNFVLTGLEARRVRIAACHPLVGQGWANGEAGSSVKVEIRLKSGFFVFGTVHDDLGQPRAGAMVEIFGAENVPLGSCVITDSQGAYRSFPVLKGQVSVWARPPLGETDESFGMTAETKSATVVDCDIKVDFGPVPEHIEWRGTFYGYDGRPQARGLVRLDRVEKEPGGEQAAASLSRSDLCDAEGRFSIRRILPGRYSVFLRLNDDTRIRNWKWMTFDSPGLFERDIRLPRVDAFGDIEGVVVDGRTGGPPQADHCFVSAVPHSAAGSRYFSATTDEQGFFCIRGLPPGPSDLTAHASGYPAKTICNVVVPGGGSAKDIRIELDSGGELLVRLTGFAGQPQRRFYLATSKTQPGQDDAWSSEGVTFPDRDSKTTLLLEAGEWLVRLAFEDGCSVERNCTVTSGAKTELVITPRDLVPAKGPIAVVGRLLRADGAPISGAHLRFQFLGWPDRAASSQPEATTDSRGSFTANGLCLGRWLVEYVDEDDYCPVLAAFRIPNSCAGSFNLDIEFPDGTVRGVLYDGRSGLPLDEAGPRWTVFLDADETYSAGHVTGVWHTGSALRLFGVAAGRYRIKIDAEGFKEYFGPPFDHPGSGDVDLGTITLER